MKAPLTRQFVIIGLLRAIAFVLVARGLTDGIVAIVDGESLPVLAVATAAIGVVSRSAIDWVSSMVSQRSATAEKVRLRSALTARILRHGARDLNVPEGELDWLATRGLDGLDPWYAQYVPAVSAAAVVPLVTGIWIAATDWVSAVILLVTLPLVPLFMWLIGTYTEDRVQQSTDAISTLSANVVELARGLPVLVGLHRAEEQADALRDISQRVRDRTMQTLRTVFLSSLALELISTLSVAMVAVFVGVRLIYGNLTLTEGLFVLVLAPECFAPLRQMGSAFHAAEEGREVADRITAMVDESGESDKTDTFATVAVRDLTVQYRNRAEPAVDHFTMELVPGEIVALVGPSGAGKSTVLAAIVGLLTDGEGVSISGDVRGNFEGRIAYVPQHPAISSDTVGDEIALALGSDDGVYAMLQLASASHLIDRHPAELSLGELRRVAIARAFARIEDGADVLLLDEPTAHLDTAVAAGVLREIASRRGDITVLIVAHDSATQAIAERVVSLGNQQLPETGSVDLRSSVPNQSVQEVDIPVGTLPTAREVLALLNPAQKTLVVAVVLGIAAALSGIALSSLSGWLIVRASEQPHIMYLMVAIVGVRFFGLGRAIFRYGERLFMHDAILASMADVRSRMWHALAHAGPRNARWLRSGGTMGAVVSAVDIVRDLGPRVFMPPVIVLGVTLLTSVALAIVDWRSGLLLLIMSTVACVLAPAMTRWADRAAAQRESRAQAELMRTLSGTVNAAADIRGNGLTLRALERITAIDSELTRLGSRGAWSVGIGTAIVTLLIGSASIVMMFTGAGAVEHRGLFAALVAVLVLTPLAMIEPIVELIPATRQWPQLQLAADTIQTITNGDVADYARPTEHIESIDLVDVTARWPGMRSDVISEFGLHAHRGDWIAIVGPSGVGKSTLFSIVMGFLPPRSGHVLFNGSRPMERHTRVAWCPQESHIFDSTMRGNLLLARVREDVPSDAEMMNALDLAGLGPLMVELPDGLETRVGPAGSYLSGGQRQRLAIARTLLARADVLLLDEPTAHLDRFGAHQLLRSVREATRNRIVLVITHHVDDEYADDIIVRLDGNQIETPS